MTNDGFIDKAGDAARKLFGGDEQRYAGGSYAAEQPRRVAADYPMGGDDVVAAGASSHYGAQDAEPSTGEGTPNAGGRYDDDPHYQDARAKHLGAFDRDYDEYRREHGSGPGGDFATWHAARQGQRHREASGLALGESPAQGSDGPHILDRSFSGTYDKD